MKNESPQKALLVVLVTALVCSSLVSAAVVILRPIQLNNQLLDRSRNVMQLTGLLAKDESPDDQEMLALFMELDIRIVNLDDAAFDTEIDVLSFDARRATNDPKLSVAIPAGMDAANLGHRSRFAPVYMVWKDDGLDRIILPVSGTGMWSELHGYISLESDLNTIAGVTFYEQNETPGLGDQITHLHWLEQWKGKQIFGAQGQPWFRISEGQVQAGSGASRHEVDALTGATVTANAVTALVHYWFGPHGYGPFLESLRRQPPKMKAKES